MGGNIVEETMKCLTRRNQKTDAPAVDKSSPLDILLVEEESSTPVAVKESVLDPVNKTLSPDVWTPKKTLRPDVKKQILDIVNSWCKKVELKYNGLNLTGSIAGYQYNDTSDIDVMVRVNDSVPETKLKELRKILPNGNNLKGTEHPVNLYLFQKSTSKQQEGVQAAIYDIMADKWIKEQDEDSVDVASLFHAALSQATSWARKISLDIDEIRRNTVELDMYRHYDADDDFKTDHDAMVKHIAFKETEIKTNWDTLKMDKHMLHSFRNEAFTGDPAKSSVVGDPKQPDFSINNILWKCMERMGYLDLLDKTIEKYEPKG